MTKTDSIKAHIELRKIYLTPIIGTYFLILYYILQNYNTLSGNIGISIAAILSEIVLAILIYRLGQKCKQLADDLGKLSFNE